MRPIAHISTLVSRLQVVQVTCYDRALTVTDKLSEARIFRAGN